VLDPLKPYLHDRLAQGERNATVLLVEITEQGYTGGYKTLARYLRPLRLAVTGRIMWRKSGRALWRNRGFGQRSLGCLAGP